MKEFPDFRVQGFDMDEYNGRFKNNNVIIHASSRDIFYPEHWGCLSVKCAFNGNEYYESNGRHYAVNKNKYLIFNEGQRYSSYIFSKTAVESFTINFSDTFRQTLLQSLLYSGDAICDNTFSKNTSFEFIEKLYDHDSFVAPVLKKLYKLSLVPDPDRNMITEIYYILLENLLQQQQSLNKEIRKIKAVKYTTQLELYRRLYYAKDFIDSCYMNDISLDKLASVACLNSAYFLRAFKKYFRLTPYQYIIRRRLESAKELLTNIGSSVTETCFAVGYKDPASFARLFTNRFGVSPHQYQYEHRKKSIFTC